MKKIFHMGMVLLMCVSAVSTGILAARRRAEKELKSGLGTRISPGMRMQIEWQRLKRRLLWNVRVAGTAGAGRKV